MKQALSKWDSSLLFNKFLLDLPLPQDVPVHQDASLSDYTTFHLGGCCPLLIHCQYPQQVESIVQVLSPNDLPFILIGGGSNLVVSDRGVECCVIRYVTERPLIQQEGPELLVSGSSLLDDVALSAAEKGLEGLSCTNGIPGTVGGAIVGNAGAFGKQIGDVLQSVSLLSLQGKKREAGPQDLGFSYRHSHLKETGEIVLSARLAFKPGNRQALLREREEILRIRREKHPDLRTYPCAGSFFRNIEPTSLAGKRQAAGWFLDQAGGKNLRCGGAFIYEKHANIIVKGANCTSENVRELSQKMAKLVKKHFNLNLIREVRFVGSFESLPQEQKGMIW